MPVSAALTVTLLVTDVVCARDDGEIKIKILSSTFFMMGLSTFSMSTFGVRFDISGKICSFELLLFVMLTYIQISHVFVLVIKAINCGRKETEEGCEGEDDIRTEKERVRKRKRGKAREKN